VFVQAAIPANKGNPARSKAALRIDFIRRVFKV
jgi:hypothetical protein